MLDESILQRLLGEVAQGNRQALRVLYEVTAPKLLGVVLRIHRDRSTAEDILQDVYLRVWQAAGTYEKAAGQPMAWLCGIARNRAIDVLRRRREDAPRPQGNDEGDWLERIADPLDAEAAIHGRGALLSCLGRLDPVHRDCVVLAYCEGYSREELAQRFERPVNTVKTWLHRALASLKTCLETGA